MDWWGYSREHGWVVLDRTIPCNFPGSGTELLFFRWRDLTTFRAARTDWNPPLYVYAPNYLLGMPDAAAQELKSLKDRWTDIKAGMQRQLQEAAIEKKRQQEEAAIEKKRQQAIANHQLFLERLGIPYQGISEASPKKGRRVTHCYSCKHPLDNAINSECSVCGWIICGCGACGCGYSL